MIFNKMINDPLPVIHFLNTQLIFTNNICILSLHFDAKLSQRTHLKKLKSVCLSKMKTIKLLENNTWGSDFKILNIIYKVVNRLQNLNLQLSTRRNKNISILWTLFTAKAYVWPQKHSRRALQTVYYAMQANPHSFLDNKIRYLLEYITKIKNCTRPHH